MVRYVEINHVFKHPFEAVARAYFQKVSRINLNENREIYGDSWKLSF